MTDPLVPPGWDAHVHVFDASRPVRPGHYRPPHRPLHEIEAIAQAHGVGHLVLVQPSVYGADNALLAEALRASAGRHRGVAVVDETLDDAALDALHAAGVRGARLNLVSPVGERSDPARRYATLAPRLVRLGWHLQWYLQPADLPLVAALHRGPAPVCVLDHLAGLGTDVPLDDAPTWNALAALAHRGAWLKLSGWYRLAAEAPYETLIERTRRCAALFGEHLVWGSDWPHTFFTAGPRPSYASTWQPVVDALGEAAAEGLRKRVPSIYAPEPSLPHGPNVSPILNPPLITSGNPS